MSEYGVEIPDESEQLDQLQPDETLVDRGVRDVLDEGYTAPERWSSAVRGGNGRRGDSIDERLAQEEPELSDDGDWDDESDGEAGHTRAGRIVDARGGWDSDDSAGEVFGADVGFAGGAASAEEAAMHVID
ncbi:MAG: DUF5709 domain-containing protein [Propionibacteriaceae bacterium]|jgi:hypothetical protein|nr:DUF5709 domain-containing protein [Propionibacteriaceae bacterium]